MSCHKQEDVSPSYDSELVTGRIMQIVTTIDDQSNNPRPRWEVDVTPLSFPGVGNIPYQRVKVFSLPDTATYKAGRYIQFRYRLIPLNQHTPWKTLFEWVNTQMALVRTERLPELALSDVKLK